VPIQQTRLRTKHNREQRLGSDDYFSATDPVEKGVWGKIMRGPLTPELWGSGETFSKPTESRNRP